MNDLRDLIIALDSYSIEDRYGTHNGKWAVVKVEETEEGIFDLVVKRVEDEKENCSGKEEHVEAEVEAGN